jgi:uncharacterized cofD-like protein
VRGPGGEAVSPLQIVAFGGGSGLSILLKGLASHVPRVRVTAVIAVTDDGGSSGELRRWFGLPALGDARKCLSAVVPDPDWAELLEHRFAASPELHRHALGNFLLAAATQRAGRLSEALGSVSSLMKARVRLLPMSDVPAALVAQRATGQIVRGQSVQSRLAGPIERVWTEPELVAPAPAVLQAIAGADVILFGPGSLFTSVLASTRAAGISRAISRSGALRVLVQNLTTQRGETDGFGLREHVAAVQAHLGPRSIDVALVHRWNGEPPQQGILRDRRALESLGVAEVMASLAVDSGRGRLHDPRQLAAAVLRLARAGERTRKLTG